MICIYIYIYIHTHIYIYICNIIAVDEEGGRVRADFRRPGRPRTKWYDTTRNYAIKKLIREGPLPRDIIAMSIKQEINGFLVQMAQAKHI